MRLSTLTASLLLQLLLLLSSSSEAFIARQSSSSRPIPFFSSRGSSPSGLFSTLAPTRTDRGLEDFDDDDDDDDENAGKDMTSRQHATSPVRQSTIPRGAISMSLDELSEALGGRGRAQLAWDCYSIGIEPSFWYGSVIRGLGHDDFETISELLPTCRRGQSMGSMALHQLSELYPSTGGRVEGGVASLVHIATSSDRTTKLLLRLSDGFEVETVIIPWKGVRSTLCVSSQVGCRQGCNFCATGRMGKLRDLTADEILAQFFFATKICRLYNLPKLSNVVFMGMGEPADNADAVIRATKILTDRQLFQLSTSRVTVSTVGPTPDAFRQLSKGNCVLAWSVHAVDDGLRRQLVPTTKYSMVDLRQGLIDALLERPANFRTTMLEIALMKGVNDSLEQADELAEFARHIVDRVPGCKLIVNLIPYNDIDRNSGSDHPKKYTKPSPASVVAFQKRLWSNGIYTHVRATRGDQESAACGQLVTKRRNNNNNQLKP